MPDTSVQKPQAEKTVAVHAIDDLVRAINPETFSDSAHGAGHRVVLLDKNAGPYRKTVLGQIFGRRGEAHYFVKQWTVPKEVAGWQFRWSEGTNAISLDFEASFVIQANQDTHAYRLVEALSTPAGPGESLYNLAFAMLFALVAAVNQRDYLVVQGITLVVAIAYVVVQFIIDFIFTVVDPRVTRE